MATTTARVTVVVDHNSDEVRIEREGDTPIVFKRRRVLAGSGSQGWWTSDFENVLAELLNVLAVDNTALERIDEDTHRTIDEW